MPFSTLSLSSELIHALPKDFKKPTDIQALAIPELLAGQDLLALANTGSGKTLAYGCLCWKSWVSIQSKKR